MWTRSGRHQHTVDREHARAHARTVSQPGSGLAKGEDHALRRNADGLVETGGDVSNLVLLLGQLADLGGPAAVVPVAVAQLAVRALAECVHLSALCIHRACE